MTTLLRWLASAVVGLAVACQVAGDDGIDGAGREIGSVRYVATWDWGDARGSRRRRVRGRH